MECIEFIQTSLKKEHVRGMRKVIHVTLLQFQMHIENFNNIIILFNMSQTLHTLGLLKNIEIIFYIINHVVKRSLYVFSQTLKSTMCH